MISACPSKSDSEQCQLTSSNPLYLADILQKQVKKILFGSFLFNFMTDTNLNSIGLAISARIFEILMFLLVLSLFLFIDDYTIWESHPYLDYIIKILVFLFHNTSYDTSPSQIFTSPPIYIMIVISIICLIEYAGFFLYRMKRFMEPYVQEYFIFVCEALSPILLFYSLVAAVTSIEGFIFSSHTSRYLYLITPFFALFSLPALIISLIRTFADIHVHPTPYTPNDPKKALRWYFCIVLACCFESILSPFAAERNIIQIFITLIVTFICAYCCLLAFSRFFLSHFSQAACLSLSLIGCLNGFLVFLHALLKDTDPIVWLVVFLLFDASMIFFSIGYVIKQTHDIEGYLILNAGAVSSQFPTSEFLHLFSFVAFRPEYTFDDQNLIETIFKSHPTSYKLQLFILRFLISKENSAFIYASAKEILKLNTCSFMYSFQAYAIMIISAELLNKNESNLWIREQQQSLVVRDCVKAHAIFWRSILNESPSDIFTNSLVLLKKVENANNFFLHNGIKKHLNDRYGQAYVDFLLNISYDYQGYYDFIGRKINKKNQNYDSHHLLNNNNNNNNNEKEYNFEENYAENETDEFYLDDELSDFDSINQQNRHGQQNELQQLQHQIDDCMIEPERFVEKKFITFQSAQNYKKKLHIFCIVILIILEVIMAFIAVFLLLFSAFRLKNQNLFPKHIWIIQNMSSAFFNATSGLLGYQLNKYMALPNYPFRDIEYVRNLINASKNFDYSYELVKKYVDPDYIKETLDFYWKILDNDYKTMTLFINSPDYRYLTEHVTNSSNMILEACREIGCELSRSTNSILKQYEPVGKVLFVIYIFGLIVLLGSLISISTGLHMQCNEMLKLSKSSVSSIYHYFFDQLPFSETRFLSQNSKSKFNDFFAHFIYFILYVIQIAVFEIFIYCNKIILFQTQKTSLSCFNAGVSVPFFFAGIYQTLYLFSDNSDNELYMFNILHSSRMLIRLSLDANETDLVPDLNISSIHPTITYISIPVRKYEQYPLFSTSDYNLSNNFMYLLKKAVFAMLESLVSTQYDMKDYTISNIDFLLAFTKNSDQYMGLTMEMYKWSIISLVTGSSFLQIVFFIACIFIFCVNIRKILFILRNSLFLNRMMALAPRDSPFVDPETKMFVYPIPQPSLGTQEIIQSFPIGFITVNKDGYIIDINDAAQSFYEGASLIGEKADNIDFDKYCSSSSINDDGQLRTFSREKTRLSKFPFLYPNEKIEGYKMIVINETTNRHMKEAEIQKLNAELDEFHKLLLPTTVFYSLHNFEIDHLIFLKQYCLVDLEFPLDFPDDDFLSIKDNIFRISGQFSTLFFVDHRRSSAFAMFSSFNVRSHQRQFIRDALKCAQCFYELFAQNFPSNKTTNVKIVISQGKQCIARLTDKDNIAISLHSRSSYKTAHLMRQAEPGETVIEKDLLNYVTDIEIRFTRSGFFVVDDTLIEYVAVNNGFSFSDGFSGFVQPVM